MGKYTAQRIHTHMQNAKHVLLVPHKNPDGDALGALIAFTHYLDKQDIRYSTYCSTDISSVFSAILPKDLEWSTKDIWKDDSVDTVVVFDTGDLSHAQITSFVKNKPYTIINIDHHATNTDYGMYNLVFNSLSSTSEILYHYFIANTAEINADMATSLLTGIISDTGNFTNSATSKEAIFIGSKLIELGANFTAIQQMLFKRLPIDALKLWGIIFSRLQKHKKLQLVHTFFSHKDMNDLSVTMDDLDGITNFLNAIHEGHAGMILKEQADGKVKGSFRTTRDDVNVAKLAQHFGGGGHIKAAGFTVDGPIEAAQKFVLKELELLCPKGLIMKEEMA
ncbi:bifunctional oligoribonuclease/PAP phosphatase NrnA [Patescibacteria group bacterium]|nr:bifunctional oligoribonuclease/PAP phosphatase NrnA [Patescibacteria group bacterium]MBU1721908.1 bifunctional oligoribonuclease/PAP phosphatase NrnA [Patescibacteria group bacterium]MBU1900860.1 bifunctional oligoribonuclease/PAP phosphatase NrnA [Patescibacteria group bacterium]